MALEIDNINLSGNFSATTISAETIALGSKTLQELFAPSTPGGYLSISGGTITGQTFFTSSLSASSFVSTTIVSGGTSLEAIIYNISNSTEDITRVQPGPNITTGGTINSPVVNLVASPSINNLFISGDTGMQSFTAGTISWDVNTNRLNLINDSTSVELNGGNGFNYINYNSNPEQFTGTIYGQNISRYFWLARFNSGVTTSYLGIPFSCTTFMLNGQFGDEPIIIGGHPIYNLVNALPTNAATRLDENGFRVGTVSNVSVSNVYEFEVSGNSNFDGNISATTIYSGSSDLYDIFISGSLDITRVQPGANIVTGGTGNVPIISVANSPSLDSLVLSGTATIPNSGLIIKNPAGTFNNIIASSAISANRTFTLPLITADDTFVTAAFSQTLTNKTLTSPVINTQVSGTITSGGSITATNFLVGATATQTLTNKTINATNNTITDTSTAVGDLLRSNGTKFVRLGMGSANQVLAVNSSGTDIGWQTPIFGQGFSFQQNTTSVNTTSTAGYGTNNLTTVGHSYTVNAPVNGTYRFGVKYNYTTTSQSISSKFRWYLDGVAQARVTEVELKDASDDVTWCTFFYATLTAGNHTLELRFASENASMTITLSSSSVEFWRVT